MFDHRDYNWLNWYNVMWVRNQKCIQSDATMRNPSHGHCIARIKPLSVGLVPIGWNRCRKIKKCFRRFSTNLHCDRSVLSGTPTGTEDEIYTKSSGNERIRTGQKIYKNVSSQLWKTKKLEHFEMFINFVSKWLDPLGTGVLSRQVGCFQKSTNHFKENYV